jgi:hypothetical protein
VVWLVLIFRAVLVESVPWGLGQAQLAAHQTRSHFGKPRPLDDRAQLVPGHTGSRDPILASVSESLPHAASASARA